MSPPDWEPGLLARLYSAHVDELSQRYGDALAAAGFDAVVIHSGSPKKRTEFDDQYFNLRPTPFFQHFLPLVEPDCALVVRPGHRPLLAHPAQQSFWEKPAPPESDDYLHVLEVVEPASVDKVGDSVRDHLPPGARRVAFVGEDAGRAAAWGLDGAVNPPSLLAALDALRVRKTAFEVACLEEANRRAAAGHEAVRARFFASDDSELELHLAYLGATLQDDAETPYKNIVALDEHAATLHHISYGRRRAPASTLLLDAGATFLGYCSDITRTWVKGGSAVASAFAALVDGVEQMQQRLCARVRTGLPYEELHNESHRQLSAILREVGIVHLSVEEIDHQGISRAFYPHGLGHSLGLQCHDVGCALVRPRADNPFLRNTSVITEGQVFTIEPGLYFIDGLLGPLREGPLAGAIAWDLVDALAPLGGIRIEDDLHVTGGPTARNLTRELLPRGGGRS